MSLIKNKITQKLSQLIAAVIGIIIIGGAFLFWQSQRSKPIPVVNTPNTNAITTATTAQSKTYNIDIKNFAFNPASLTINKGDTIIWTNDDSATHQLAGIEINSPKLANKQTYSVTLDAAGNYNYHCSIHPTMKGTIIVK